MNKDFSVDDICRPNRSRLLLMMPEQLRILHLGFHRQQRI